MHTGFGVKLTLAACGLLLGLGLTGCGDSSSDGGDGTSNGATSNATSNGTSSNGTSGGSNGTSSNGATSNGTTSASNGTSSNGGTSNGTSGTSNGTTSEGIGDCADFASCGGNPVGKWDITEFCLELPDSEENPFEECEEASLTIEADIDGSIEIDEDGTYLTEFTNTISGVIEFPLSCLGGGTCAQFEEALNDPNSDGPSGWECDQKDDFCDCESAPDEEEESETGTWSADGDTMTFIQDDPDPDEDPETEFAFCVEGDTMHVLSDDDEEPLQIEFSRGQ